MMSRDALYRAVEGIHNLYFESMRFGQFMDVFLGYVVEKGYDPYYLTDAELVNMMKQFVEDLR